MAQQPDGMTNEEGVILTVGIAGGGDSFQFVFPVVNPSTGLDLTNLCSDACNSFQDFAIPTLQPILSSDVYIAFVQGQGMVPGRIPFRNFYDSTTWPGTSAAGACPTNVAVLGIIYQDPADLDIGQKRILQSRTFFTGVAKSQLTDNAAQGTLLANILAFMQMLQAGFLSDFDSDSKWYRVLDVPKPLGTSHPIKRLLVPEVRGGIYTQKRRVVPRLG